MIILGQECAFAEQSVPLRRWVSVIVLATSPAWEKENFGLGCSLLRPWRSRLLQRRLGFIHRGGETVRMDPE